MFDFIDVDFGIISLVMIGVILWLIVRNFSLKKEIKELKAKQKPMSYKNYSRYNDNKYNEGQDSDLFGEIPYYNGADSDE